MIAQVVNPVLFKQQYQVIDGSGQQQNVRDNQPSQQPSMERQEYVDGSQKSNVQRYLMQGNQQLTTLSENFYEVDHTNFNDGYSTQGWQTSPPSSTDSRSVVLRINEGIHSSADE